MTISNFSSRQTAGAGSRLIIRRICPVSICQIRNCSAAAVLCSPPAIVLAPSGPNVGTLADTAVISSVEQSAVRSVSVRRWFSWNVWARARVRSASSLVSRASMRCLDLRWCSRTAARLVRPIISRASARRSAASCRVSCWRPRRFRRQR